MILAVLLWQTLDTQLSEWHNGQRQAIAALPTTSMLGLLVPRKQTHTLGVTFFKVIWGVNQSINQTNHICDLSKYHLFSGINCFQIFIIIVFLNVIKHRCRLSFTGNTHCL